MDGEDREFYKSMIEDLNTDKKSKAQKKEKNKKMLEKICSNNENLLVKLEFSSIIQDNNEIYELNIEKVSLESERITNLRFFTSQWKVLQIDNFNEVFFNNEKDKSYPISKLYEFLPQKQDKA